MSVIPILLALVGIAVLVWAIRSFILVRRLMSVDGLPNSWRWAHFAAFILGIVLGISTLWQGYPLNGGHAAGVPFMAAWFDARGRDYVGPFSLPALLGNLVCGFLLPQTVLAIFLRKHRGSEATYGNS